MRTEDGVMNMSLSPSLWEEVAMRKAKTAIARIIDDLKEEVRKQSTFIIPPLLWTATVEMPMIYGNTYIYVKPYQSKTD
jgi:hypothetical protein